MSTKNHLVSGAVVAALGAVALGAAAPAHATPVGDVFYVAMENHNWTQPSTYTALQQIKGNSAAPFISSLVTPGNPYAAMVSYASNYTNVPIQPAGSPSGAGAVHPSEPNYVWHEAGVTGARNDADPYGANINTNTTLFPLTNPNNNVVNAPNLSAQLQNSGRSWKVYAEDSNLVRNGSNQLTNTPVAPGQTTVPLTSYSGTSPAYTNPYYGTNQYDYAAKHVGELYFAATNGGNDPSTSNPEAKYYAPLQQLTADLTANTVGQYNFIVPNQFNDMHTTLSGGFTDPRTGISYTGDAARIAQGDYLLSVIIPQIEASAAFKNNGAIVIWNDETEGETAATLPQFTSMEILISPLAKGNAYTNTISYNHSSDLLTLEQIFGQSCLGDACNATNLSDLFVAGAIPAYVPEPASLALLGTGLAFLLSVRRRRG